jgi:hypothetical protein
MTKLLRSSIRFAAGAGVMAALAACSVRPDAHAALLADTGGARAHASGGDVTRTPARTGAHTPTTSGKTVGHPAMDVVGDTMHPHLEHGRNAHDSTSYISAIRAGRKAMATWPTPPSASAPGAILPGHRIVAFYGNPLVKNMGVLGAYPVDQMLAKLDTTVAEWQKADPSTPVMPALHLIAVVAQGGPGRDGMYRLRMDTALIEKVYGWAQRKNALLFLDVQVGWSTLPAELPRLIPFLSRPNVELGIDPEFSMHYDKQGVVPDKKIGEMDASDVNYAIQTLAQVAEEHHLPPKILIVHRFTRTMVLHPDQIRVDPHVQVVMDMDGLGPPWLKFDSYRDYIVSSPVEFTGFKLFYKQDVKKGDPLLTPAEVLQLRPRPLYIQYQ